MCYLGSLTIWSSAARAVPGPFPAVTGTGPRWTDPKATGTGPLQRRVRLPLLERISRLFVLDRNDNQATAGQRLNRDKLGPFTDGVLPRQRAHPAYRSGRPGVSVRPFGEDSKEKASKV